MPSRKLLLAGCGLLTLVLSLAVAQAGTPGAALAVDNGGLSGPLTPLRAPGGTPVSQTSRSAPTPLPPAAVALRSGWSYLPDPQNVGLREDWARGGAAGLPWTPVAIPNDLNPLVSRAAGSGTVGWYQVRFTGPPTPGGRAWAIAFESVRRHALVWLNGQLIGSSDDPYAPFTLPARRMVPNAPNVLTVRVDDFKSGSLPEDWWNWGGITGPVTLTPTGRLTLGNLGLLPELGCAHSCGEVLVKGSLTNNSTETLSPQVLVTVTSPSGSVTVSTRRLRALAPGASTGVRFRASVPAPLALWSPRSPSLYQVRVQAIAQGRVEEEHALKIGMRSVQVRGGIIYLNGRRLWLHGAAIHEDILGRGAALSDGDIDTLVSELRSLGANVTRAHYLLSARLLNALDAAGIMVWEQPPVDHADLVLQTPAGRARALGMLRSTIFSARNHPSVIIDSVGNELSPNPDATPGTRAYLGAAIALARRLNPTVPVALDTYCYTGFPAQRIYSKLGVIGISSYFGWYKGPPGHSIAAFAKLEPFMVRSHTRYRQQALVVSEFGSEALFNGPVSVKGSYAFQSDYLRRTFAVLDRLPFMNGAIYWTLREFAVGLSWSGGATLPPGSSPDGIHHKGLIAYDGAQKPAFAVAARLFTRPPAYVR